MSRHPEGMDLITANALAALADMPRPLLQVHVGLLIYLGCQLMLGTRRGAIVAALAAVLFVVLHEGANRLFHGGWRWADTASAMVLTLFWPTMCFAVSRFRRRLRARRAGRGAPEQLLVRAALAHG